MPNRLAPFALLVTLTLVLPAALHAQADPTSRSWNQPVEPYRIAGNLYYVGASDISSFLVTTPEGHILLDGGFVETVPIIRENVKKLGFRLEDVKILLSSHAHYDHAGGLAELKRLTGAKLAAGAADETQLERGGKNDPVLGDDGLFPAVEVDRLIRDGDTVTLGGTTLTARATPGHTAGCTTWTMKVEDGGKSLDIVIVGSATVLPQMRLLDQPGQPASYPGIATDYEKTFATLKSLPCDVFLAVHGSFCNATEKAARLKKGETPNPFVDPAGYRAWVERAEGAYRKRLEEEKAKAKAAPAQS